MIQVKAVRKFKQLISRRRPEILESILGQQLRIVLPPEPIDSAKTLRVPIHRSQTSDIDERRPIEQALVREGVHRRIDADKLDKPLTSRDDAAVLGRGVIKPVTTELHISEAAEDGESNDLLKQSAHPLDHISHLDGVEDFHGKGQAHDPLSEEFRFLAVGPAAGQYPRTPRDSPPIVSESPSAAEENIYDAAYHEEVERIRKNSSNATLYMTRRVEDTHKYKDDQNMLGIGEDKLMQGIHGLIAKAKDARKQHEEEDSDDKKVPKDSGLKSLIQGGASPEGIKKLKQAAVEDFRNNYQDQESSSIKASAKKLAQAAIQDIKDVPQNIPSHSKTRTDQKDTTSGSSSVKSTIKDLISQHREQKNKPTEQEDPDKDGSSMAYFKAAVKDIKQTNLTNKAQKKKKKDADNTMPGLEAIADASTRKL